jgi:hypothetical protein
MKNQEVSLVKNIFDVDYLMNNFALGKLHFFINVLKYLRTLYKRDIETSHKMVKSNIEVETNMAEIESLNKELTILNINIVNVELAMRLGEGEVIQFTESGFDLYLN